MINHPKNLVWGAYTFEKMPKKQFWNVVDVYSKSFKNQTIGDRKDLKYGLKRLLGCLLINLGG